jgi:chemotaxis response regulator CheB
VYGMPKRAIELGGAVEILSPSEIVTEINEV